MQSSNKSWIWILLGIVVVLAIIFGITQNKKDSAPATSSGSEKVTTINAAAILGLTGYASADSEEIKRGIELAKADLLKQGITLNMVIEDDGTDPVKSVTALQKILATEKPTFLIGPVWSFLGNAVASQIVAANIPTFQPANTSEFITTDNFKPFFYGFPKISNKRELAEKFLKENKVKTVLVATDSDSWGTSHRLMYEEATKNTGVKIIGNEILTPGDPSIMNTVLLKYKNNQPDAILLSDGYDSVDNVFLKRYAQYGYKSFVLGDKSMLARDNKDLAKSNGHISILIVTPNKDFVAKYKAVYGVDPNPYADSAYDGVMMLAQAVQKVGTDPDAIIKYLKNSSFKYQGFQTRYSFDEKGDFSGSTWAMEDIR